MTLDIPDDDIPLFIRAPEHHHAYHVAEKLKRKPPEQETRKPVKTAKRKRG